MKFFIRVHLGNMWFSDRQLLCSDAPTFQGFLYIYKNRSLDVYHLDIYIHLIFPIILLPPECLLVLQGLGDISHFITPALTNITVSDV